jgi:hypothetical protein
MFGADRRTTSHTRFSSGCSNSSSEQPGEGVAGGYQVGPDLSETFLNCSGMGPA